MDENHNENIYLYNMHSDSDDFFVGGDPVQAHDHCPEDHGGQVGHRSQGEEDGVEGEWGGEEEEQDGEDDRAWGEQKISLGSGENNEQGTFGGEYLSGQDELKIKASF